MKMLGGLLPSLMGDKKENRGFALGIIPGLLFKDQYREKEKRRALEDEVKGLKARQAELDVKAPQPIAGMKKGGKVSSASKRADGCAVKGKTKGRFV